MPDYDHATLVDVIELKAPLFDASMDEFAQAMILVFAKSQKKIVAGMRSLEGGGGWEIVSHSTTRIDRYVLVTYLLRRPVQPIGNR